MTTKSDSEMATSGPTSPQGTVGTPSDGSPPGTVPRSLTPCSERSKIQLTAIEPTTAISAPGIFGETNRRPTITTITDSDTSTVAPLASGIALIASKNFRSVPLDDTVTP